MHRLFSFGETYTDDESNIKQAAAYKVNKMVNNAYNLPDYCGQYFQYEELTKIQGQPNIDSIVKMLRQVKRNAQRVKTTLGVVYLVNLSMVVPTMDYLSISNAHQFV